MPSSGELLAEQSALIVGRDAGLTRLRGLVDPAPSASRVLLVTGEAGIGKTVLLADTAERARAAGMRVLWVTGRESESKLAFAGLHQLLRPVLPAAAGLPGLLARALLGALGLSDPGAADRLSRAEVTEECGRPERRSPGRLSWNPSRRSGRFGITLARRAGTATPRMGRLAVNELCRTLLDHSKIFVRIQVAARHPTGLLKEIRITH